MFRCESAEPLQQLVGHKVREYSSAPKCSRTFRVLDGVLLVIVGPRLSGNGPVPTAPKRERAGADRA